MISQSLAAAQANSGSWTWWGWLATVENERQLQLESVLLISWSKVRMGWLEPKMNSNNQWLQLRSGQQHIWEQNSTLSPEAENMLLSLTMGELYLIEWPANVQMINVWMWPLLYSMKVPQFKTKHCILIFAVPDEIVSVLHIETLPAAASQQWRTALHHRGLFKARPSVQHVILL